MGYFYNTCKWVYLFFIIIKININYYIFYPMNELEKLKEKINDLEYRLVTVETIQHTHNRKHRMIETGKSYAKVVEDENKLTELLEKNLLKTIEEDDK